jgi:hypothetical protein
VSLFRPPRRSGLRAPWISGVLAVLIAAALAGVGAAAGAQPAPEANGTATTLDDQTTDSTTPESSVPDDSTTEPSVDDGAADDPAADDPAADDPAAQDPAAEDPAAEDPAADPNGNIKNLPLNTGDQPETIVFNDVPYGEIPTATPQVLVLRPGSGRIIPLNREINLRARFSNFRPGTFSDPKSEYGEGTQRLDENGFLNGHNHACIQRVARDGSVPGERCDSFVVMAQEGTSDIITGIGPPLTQPGRYRVCIDAAAGNHYPAARAFAQRGGPVDCVRVLAMDFSQLRRSANQ